MNGDAVLRGVITGSGFVALTINGTTITGTEGITTGTTTVATFTDPNPNASASDFTATIDWGDGTSTTGTVVAQSTGGFAVDGVHVYADEGKYTVGVTIKDIGGAIASTTSTATVADASLTAAAVSVTGSEGLPIASAAVATFTDANPNATASDFTATINWGDGTSTTGTVVAQNGGGFAVDGTHTYADEGKYTVTTSIKDVGGSTASVTSEASIADAALSALAVGGQPESLFQSVPDLFFTPPNSDFVDDVAGNQQMFDTFKLGSDSLVTSITFDVSNLTQAFPNWQSEPLTLAIYNIAPGGRPGTELYSATFTPNVDAHINLNLGFATALVTYDSHLALNPGTYLITYYNQDGLGAIGFVNGGSDQAFAEHLSTGTISPVGESLGIRLNGDVIAPGTTIRGIEGTAISGATVATFTDANPNATASDFTATIDWGDGTSTIGTVVAQSDGSFAVDGTHTYADEGKYALSTTIKDVGGSTTSATSSATVADASLTATSVNITGTEGS
jgi:PKD repeat protein